MASPPLELQRAGRRTRDDRGAGPRRRRYIRYGRYDDDTLLQEQTDTNTDARRSNNDQTLNRPQASPHRRQGVTRIHGTRRT